jgi:putative ABC transport system ATP-binding protein
MTALDNVALPLSYAGYHVRQRRQIAYNALKRVGLEERVNFKPSQLSGGQQQRVAIARALVNNPKIILADEPTGALDSHSGIQVMELFHQLNEEGVTVVMITHDASIASHAKRVLHIFDGEIAEDVERKRKEAEQNEQSVEAPLPEKEESGSDIGTEGEDNKE